MHKLREVIKEQKEETKIIKKKKEYKIYATALEYLILVAIVPLTFYFGSWLWTVCLGLFFICMQIMKVVDWLTDKKKTECDICQKELIGEENEKT